MLIFNKATESNSEMASPTVHSSDLTTQDILRGGKDLVTGTMIQWTRSYFFFKHFIKAAFQNTWALLREELARPGGCKLSKVLETGLFVNKMYTPEIRAQEEVDWRSENILCRHEQVG